MALLFTGGVVTRSYVTSLRKGRIENPGFEKLNAIAKAMGFPPELWFEEVENEPEVSSGRPSWFLDRDDKPALLDEELVEALRDETARAILREVVRLSERERRVVLGILRQFEEFKILSLRSKRRCGLYTPGPEARAARVAGVCPKLVV